MQRGAKSGWWDLSGCFVKKTGRQLEQNKADWTVRHTNKYGKARLEEIDLTWASLGMSDLHCKVAAH